ncbi:MAG: sulfotransferase domain-containing protein [Pseudomonadota bacterium]
MPEFARLAWHAARAALPGPADRRRAAERWLRGWAEYRRLRRADWVLMSWGKSGRTWLRVMLSRFYQLRCNLPESELLDFDNLHRRNPAAPRVFFTHNNYLRDYTGNWQSKAHFAGKPMVLLVRDPRDVAVSQYFQWRFRMQPRKKLLNGYPPHGTPIELFDFVTDPQVGLPRVIDYFNDWAASRAELSALLLVRYEDMRADPRRELGRILAFTGTPGTPQEIAAAVEFAAYDNMQRLEASGFFRASGARVRAADAGNPQSFKVRRAKVGGYRDYFDDAKCAALDAMVRRLDPLFGY